MTRRASFGVFLVVMSLIASAAYAEDYDHISTTVSIDIAGFTVTSTGTVSYRLHQHLR
jgi:hypothetical protein